MDLSATTLIHAPAAEVYRYVSDPAHDVTWRTGVTDSGLTTEPPLALGSEGYVTAGNQIARWKVTAIGPGVFVDWELTDGPFAGSGGYRLEDIDGNTRFTLVADVEPRGLYRLLGPLFSWKGRKQNQTDVDGLRDLLEARTDHVDTADLTLRS
jgi:hypothetical protein